MPILPSHLDLITDSEVSGNEVPFNPNQMLQALRVSHSNVPNRHPVIASMELTTEEAWSRRLRKPREDPRSTATVVTAKEDGKERPGNGDCDAYWNGDYGNGCE